MLAKQNTFRWSSLLCGACPLYIRTYTERQVAGSRGFPAAAPDAAKGPAKNERSWRRSKRVCLASSRDIAGENSRHIDHVRHLGVM